MSFAWRSKSSSRPNWLAEGVESAGISVSRNARSDRRRRDDSALDAAYNAGSSTAQYRTTADTSPRLMNLRLLMVLAQGRAWLRAGQAMPCSCVSRLLEAPTAHDAGA